MTPETAATALTAEHIVDAARADKVKISPDGTMVAYTVSPMGQAEEQRVSAIWLAWADGARPPLQLTAGTASDHSPRWSPDSQTLYFLSDREKKETFQVYRISLTGGEAEAITTWNTGVAEIAPLPPGDRLALLAIDEESDEDKARKEQRDDADVYGERWQLQRLRLLDLATREIVTVETLGERHISEVAPNAMGDKVAVIAWPTPELDNISGTGEVLVVELATQEVHLATDVTSGGSDLCWGPDDATLLYGAHLLPGLRGGIGIFVVDAAGGEPRPLAHDLDACPVYAVTTAAGTPFVRVDDHLDTWIGELDLATGHLQPRVAVPGSVTSFDVSGDGQTLALIRTTPDDFTNVWLARGGVVQRLSDLNPALRDITFGPQEAISWQAPDGMTIEGLLILPPGKTRADGPFPLVTLVHGGPYGRFANALQFGWSSWGQWLATLGYASLLPNPRGGSGRGHDFANRVAGAVGKEDWGDILAGVDYVVSEGIADPDRLGIGGWSQGGFMTAWAVGQTPRFKFGIMGAGVSDWGMMVATSDLPRFEQMLGASAGWEGIGPHPHDALSPISFAHRVTTPVLVLHGENDARVPVSQGRYFAQALRAHDTPVTVVVYPREPHGIRERAHQLDLLRRVREWVERWLGSA